MSNYGNNLQLWLGTFFGPGKRYRVVALPIVIALALTSFLSFAAPTPGGSHPVAVGPVSSDTGFPTWYKDSTGTRLELCLDGGANPLCGFLPGDIADPNAPITVPDNFPSEGEAFYMLGSASMTTDASGGKALLGLALEAAFATPEIIPGDQVTFGRIRIWIDNLIGGARYKVTHPYGYDFLTAGEAGGRRAIRSTEDIGIGAPGDFTGALNSRIGPFLKWDPAVAPAAPAGYIGDPNVLHAVTGSPFNTNFFRVEGPASSFPGSPDLCTDPALGDDPVARDDCIQINTFSMIGKYATNAGVNATRATYSRSSASGGSIDVFATSVEGGQSIQVVKGSNYATTLLTGDGAGRYMARVGFTNDPPAQLTVRNASDNPVANKTISVADLVTITTARYDADADILTIAANSSDTFTSPTLTATGYGDLAGGTLVVDNLPIAPDQITVTSAKGGSDTARVEVVGANDAPVPVVAGITVPDGVDVPQAAPSTALVFNVQQGQVVTLDGSSSNGDITSYAWAQISGSPVSLQATANAATKTFVAPSLVDTLVFRLTVAGSGSLASDTKDVTIDVVAPQPPVANAGPDQIAVVGAIATLDGSQSQNAGSYSWVQIVNVGDPSVTLNGATTARPTFTYPNFAGPLTFQVTVQNVAGTATDTVQVLRASDTLSNLRVQFTRSKNDWRIDGTAQILGQPAGPGNIVRAYLGVYATEADAIAAGRKIGEAQVDSTGAWSISARSVAARLRAVAGDSVTLFSTRGANQKALVTIK